jgi:pyruvate,water dikinase
MTYLIRFDDNNALDPSIVGQKFSSLARAHRAGFAVPPATAISAEAHRLFIAHRRWPEGLIGEVLEIAAELSFAGGIAVRSSAIREDLERHSFAGQYSTFLNVANEKDLKDRIEQCWRSAETETVKSYLRLGTTTGGEEEIPLMGVILQKMVPAASAGVAFSRNPMNPSRDEVVIEGTKGLAENLVSGHTSPCRVLVDDKGVVRESVSPEDSKRIQGKDETTLEDIQWKTIANFIRQLEADIFQKPLDIEWAIDEENKLWLLQSRYITTVEDDEPVAPAGIWTRKIANDLWADRLTPFLADAMMNNAPRYDLSRILKFLGIPVVMPTLTVINGYLYINNKSIAQVLAFIPRKFWIAELRAIFPPEFELNKTPHPSILRQLSVAVRFLLLPFREPGVNPFICLWLSYHHQRKISRHLVGVDRLPDTSAEQTFKKVLLALDTMAQIQITNQWPYAHATVFMWVLRWLVVERLGLQHSDFLRMLSRGGNNITIDIEQKFREISKKLSRDEVLQARFLKESPEQLADSLPEKIKYEIEDFLNKYGCRSPQRSLYVPRWAETPETVIGILQSLIRHDYPPLSESAGDTPPASTQLKPKDNEGLRYRLDLPSDASLKNQGARYPLFARVGVRLVLRLAMRLLDRREDLRFLLDKVLYQVRKGLLVLGKQTGLGEQVLFLNPEELKQLVYGKLSINEAKLLALERHKSFLKPFGASTFYIDGQPINEFPIDAEVMRGTGTSPGRVTGRARIVEDPATADITEGDILIANNADPGWTPVLSIVSGIVAEEGGLLNHCSIVARELGVPSIVGVRQATQKIPEGSLITIDGSLGLIRIEAQKINEDS